jgi:glycerophosphoryl diester phosphodiesterase
MLASCRYSHFLKWSGRGSIPMEAKDRLTQYIQAAHQNDLKVRLWAAPDNTKVWKALLDCGVDLINTNKIQKLKRFLINDGYTAANNTSYSED